MLKMKPKFFNLLLNLIDPFHIVRGYIIEPINDLILVLFEDYRYKTEDKLLSARDVALRVILGLFVIALVVCIAIFLYIAFYFAYMPTVTHTRPVHLQFKACDNARGICTFPSAHVSLTKKQQLLMVGQPYRVILDIDVPESSKNKELGMFLVCAEMRDQTTALRGHSCRSAILGYRSELHTWIKTWVTSPFLLLGLSNEKQTISTELFSNYEDDQLHPVTDVYVELQSKDIQFYSVVLQITAHFTGLRYIMFHWPIFSSIVGICTNLFFVSFISLLSWYHWSDTTWIDEAKEKYKKIRVSPRLTDTYIKSKKIFERDELSTSIDETNNILDDEDISLMEEIKTLESSKMDDFNGTGDGPDGDDVRHRKPFGLSADE